MNHAIICNFKNQLKHPFPYLILGSNIFQPIFPESLSYKNDNVVVSQKQKSNQNKQKDAPSLCDKVFQSKTEVSRVQTESV